MSNRRPVGRGVLSLLCLAAVLFTGCTRTQPAAIRFGLAYVPQKLDPRFSTDATSSRLIRLLYRQLVDFDRRQRPVAALASWARLSPLHYRFRLDPSRARFHDGRPLTAEDVKATYDSVLDPKLASPHRSSVALIREVRVIDQDTVDFMLSKPDPAFPGYLVIGIMPKHLLERGHDFSAAPVGSGPFRFHSWPQQGLLRLTRIKDRQLFEFVHITNANTRVLKLLRGEVDIIQNNLPYELTRYLESKKHVKVMHRNGSNFTYLSFNLRYEPLQDRRVRLAIAHAIDRAQIVRHMFGRKTRLAAAIFTPDHWAGDPQLRSYAYDPVKARALLRQAGYGPQRPLRLVYKTTNVPFRVRIATIIQYQLKQVGIQVSLRTYEWTTFYSDIKKGNFHLYSLSWVAVKSPDIFRYVYHSASIPQTGRQHASVGANRNAYRDTLVDRYIEQAEQTYDPAQRVRYYRLLHKRLLETLPVVPLWYEEHMAAVRRRVRGYRIAYDGNYDSLAAVTVRR